MVPHLRTVLTGALSDIESKIIEATPMIERWFRMEWQEHTPAFYCSVDVRNAGFKLAPADTNLFPGGFNHLAEEMYPLATQAALAAIEKYCPDAKNVLIIPEERTQDSCYLQNIAQLSKILRLTGLNVRLGSLSEQLTRPLSLALPSGESLTIEPLERNGRRITLDHGRFEPCTILLNNDLTDGQPLILENLKEQVLLPQLHAGWTVRRKSRHFEAYNDVAKKFSKALGIDSWLINPYFAQFSGAHLNDRSSEDELAHLVEVQLKKIAKKYREYDIKDKPFLMMKADAGGQGVGVHTIYSPDDIKALSQQQRSQLTVVKQGVYTTDVLLQEGVPTSEQYQGHTAEPVVYMIDRFVVGGFYRVNDGKGVDESLDDTGRYFKPLSFVKQSERTMDDLNTAYNRFYPYGVIARLAMLAASLEMERSDPNPEVM